MQKIPEKLMKKQPKCWKIIMVEKNIIGNIDLIDKKELNDVLVHFYLDARKVNGEKYKVSSLENFRHSLNRYLQSPPVEKQINRNQTRNFRINFPA